MKSVQQEIKESNPEFHDEIVGLSKEDLDSRIVQLVKDLEEVDNAKEQDEGLQALRQQAKEAGAPYRDAKKAIKVKIKFILETLESRG